ncbi:MAG: inositol monophosphatase family protein [Paracoccaceae bacterium]|nr:inositol monophosphatase family protein [Paracoccaceae bacterium]
MNEHNVIDPTASEIKEILADCEHWADLAKQLARKYFREQNETTFKSDESPVTVIDCMIERALKEEITSKYPNDAFFGEESGIEGDTTGNLWVIDPIDGTRSFISGNPLFGMLLSYVKSGKPVAGVISMPMLEELYMGGLGVPATCNGNPISVSSQTRLEHAVLYINEGEKLIDEHPAKLSKLLKVGQTRRFGYDCYPHALLAAGHIDAVIDYDLKPYDYLALVTVVKAAGGVMTDWNGKALDLDSNGAVVSAATPELHQALLKILV